jgi:iron(III) transport system substrate-binding protein
VGYLRASAISLSVGLIVVLVAACSQGAAPAGPAGGGAAAAPGAGAATQPGGGGSGALDDLYQAARREGRVVIVGPGVSDLQVLYDAFQQKYPGIRVQPLTARGPEMIARLDSEFASGQRQIGVFTTALSTMYQTQQAGRFELWEPPSAKGLPDRYREADASFNAASITPYGILYNTNLVRPEEAPRTWQDLTDSKWRGKIYVDDPRTAGGGQIMMVGFSHHPELGWPYVEALGRQQLQFTRDRPEIPNSVARGEYAISMPVSARDYVRLKAANAPVELILPKVGSCECATGYAGVIKGAPQPSAAKLLVDFHFAPDGQRALAERGDFPVMPGAAGPSGFPPASDIPLLPQLTKDDIDHIDDYITRFDAIFIR